MKKIIYFCVLGVCLVVFSPLLMGDMIQEYPESIGSDYKMPQEIKIVTNPKELQSFLESSRDLTRMAAVKRLSEIEGPNSINSLISIYKKEQPITENVERSPVVKLEVIKSLGRIQTDQAKNALLNMLKELWEKGPKLSEKNKEKRYFYYDSDFRDCTPLLLQMLYKWSGDKGVSELAEIVANSEDVEKYYRGPNSIGQRAWQICIKSEMIGKGIITEKEIAKYLVDYEEEILKKGITKVPLGPLRRTASFETLVTLSENSLSLLLEKSGDTLLIKWEAIL